MCEKGRTIPLVMIKTVLATTRENGHRTDRLGRRAAHFGRADKGLTYVNATKK